MRSPRRASRFAARALAPVMPLMFLCGAIVAGCGDGTGSPPTSGELLLVYSGDFRGFFEPCG